MAQQNEIDLRLKELFASYRVTPGPASFGVVLEKLEKKRRKRLIWLLLPVGLFITAFLFYWQYTDQTATLKDTISFTTKKYPHQRSSEATNERTVPGFKSVASRKGRSGQNSEAVKGQQKPPLPKGDSGRSQLNAPEKDLPGIRSAGSSDDAQSPDLIAQNKNEIPEGYSEQILPDFLAGNYPGLPFLIKDPELKNIAVEERAQLPVRTKRTVSPFISVNFAPTYVRHQVYTPHQGSIPGYDPGRMKDERAFSFNASAKAGATLNGKWEFFVGMGYQMLSSREKVPVKSAPQFLYNSVAPNQPSSVATYHDMKKEFEETQPGEYYLDRFSHVIMSAGLGRYKTLGNMTRIRLGMELNAGYLVKASSLINIGLGEYGYNRSTGNKLYKKFYSGIKLNAGWVEQLSPSLELQVIPGVFYSFTSVFSKYYLFRDKPFGAECNLSLVYRFRN
jgi:hypothetical protein